LITSKKSANRVAKNKTPLFFTIVRDENEVFKKINKK